jgi:hypothetical protein
LAITNSKRAASPFLSLPFFIKIFNFINAIISITSNPGRFGGTNRPGYPAPMKLMAKFASASSARAPLNMMHERTKDQPEDVLTLNVLADIIQCCFLPGDTIIIAMQDPTQFCVGHRDVVSC